MRDEQGSVVKMMAVSIKLHFTIVSPSFLPIMSFAAVGCLLLLVLIGQEASALRKWTIRSRTTALRSTTSKSPQLECWEVYGDRTGISLQRQRSINGFTFNQESSEQMEAEQGCLSLSGLWKSDRIQIGPAATVFLTLVPGVDYDWHENPAPQWIIPLSGSW